MTADRSADQQTDGTTYAGSRRIIDADAHLMEPPGWLESYVDPSVRAELGPLDRGDPGLAEILDRSVAAFDARRTDDAEAAAAKAEFMSMPRKGWVAWGAGDAAERTEALDALGFELQVIYPTGSFNQVILSPTHIQADATIGMNRGLAEFCADDPRLLPVAYVPFHHGPDEALRILGDAADRGCPIVMVDMVPAKGAKSPTHPDYDPVWAAIVDNDLLASTHIGLDNRWRPVRPEFFDNDRTLAHFRSDAPGDALSYMAIGYPAELFLAAMVFDGVLERFPDLRISVAELGAVWVPSFLRHLDVSGRVFRRMQDLSHLSLDPSDYIRRQVRFTPFAGEPVGWMMAEGGAELFCFSSDYPHHEGTDDPIRRFDKTMDDVDGAGFDRFYRTNFAELLGSRLPAPVA